MLTRTLLVFALVLALGACGYKGPLSLPKPAAAAPSAGDQNAARPAKPNPDRPTPSKDSP